MVRTFPADFVSHQADAASRPYLILEIQWGDATGTRYYLDRAADSFQATGARHPAGQMGSALVVDWGQISLALKEMQIGSVDSFTIKLTNPNQEITRILGEAQKHRKTARVWRMWDENDVTWSADAAKVFEGSTKPFAWSESDNTVSITLEDASRRLIKSLGCPATRDIFENITEEYEDRHIPYVWGNAKRVEAILVDSTWWTRISEQIPETAGDPVTIEIDHHPSDMGAATGAGNPYQVLVGDDLMEGYFTQAANPDNQNSTFTITTEHDSYFAQTSVRTCVGTGANRYALFQNWNVVPQSLGYTLTSLVSAGTACKIEQNGTWVAATVATINYPSPYTGSYKITFTSSTVNSNLWPGQRIKFLDTPTARRPWPAGTVLRPKSGSWVYAANCACSKNIKQVEGFGKLGDEFGPNFKDFIPLGRQVADTVDGSTTVTDDQVDAYTVNLCDDTWDYTGEGPPNEGSPADLGHPITTIRFNVPPRAIDDRLDDNRLWVTIQGFETDGDSSGALITNPATVILEYLENDRLLNVPSAFIDEDSFVAAANSLADRKVGFAQIEEEDGLKLLQDIARQCQSVLFFDQGWVSMKVLSNSGTPSGEMREEDIEELSLGQSEIDVDELVTRLTAWWQNTWDDKTKPKRVLGVNSGAASEFGAQGRELDIWLYSRRSHVVSEIAFWLSRWSKVWRTIEFTSFHGALAYQPADWINLSYLTNRTRRGADLVIDNSNNKKVTSALYTFAGSDIGREIQIDAATGWTEGVYAIIDAPGGAALLENSPGAAGLTQGVWRLGDKSIFHKQACEILEVTDTGPGGLVNIRCRYPAFSY